MASTISAFFLFAGVILQSSLILGHHNGTSYLGFDKYNGYPSDDIDTVLKKYNSVPFVYEQDGDEELQKLLYEDHDDMNCRTQVWLKKPFTLIDPKTGRVYPVVQSKYFSQKLRDVSCRNPGEPCFEGISLKGSLKAKCETEQVQIQLYVYISETNKVEPMTVPYNCCCKCTIRDTANWS